MPDLGFSELRADVEHGTYLPEFQEVTRRARKHKMRRRLATTAKILGVLSVATPGLIVGGVVIDHVYRAPAETVMGFSGAGQEQSLATTAPAPVTRSVVAADGIDLAHSYALVDVCSGRSCSLQLSQIDPRSTSGMAQRVGLLRQKSTDVLNDPRVVVVNTSTAIVSAMVGTAGRQYQTIDMAAASGAVSSALRPVQTTVQGAIRVVKGATGLPATLPHQPAVSVPELASESGGWWVCGTAPGSGELAVSVSRDRGGSWSTHTLGLLPDVTDASGSTETLAGATLATSDGINVYVLVLSGGQMVLTRSLDGGQTWAPTAIGEVWPTGSKYGLVTRADGSLLVWFTRAGVTTYLRSVDHGETFTPDVGPPAPGGAIVKVEDGYLTLGSNPTVSRNGMTWSAADVPYVAAAG
jgi:hypothetical protein